MSFPYLTPEQIEQLPKLACAMQNFAPQALYPEEVVVWQKRFPTDPSLDFALVLQSSEDLEFAASEPGNSIFYLVPKSRAGALIPSELADGN